MRQRVIRTRSQEFRIVAVLVVLAATAAVTAGIVSSARNGRAFAEAAPLSSFEPIQQVAPNVKAPPPRRGVRRAAHALPQGDALAGLLLPRRCDEGGRRELARADRLAPRSGNRRVHDGEGALLSPRFGKRVAAPPDGSATSA